MRTSSVFIAAAGLALAATVAHAQPYAQEVAQPDVQNFEGPYLGAAVGYGWTSVDLEIDPFEISWDRSGSGVSGGAFAGFGGVNGRLFGAVEGLALLSSTDVSGSFVGANVAIDQKHTFGLMAKIGYVPADRFLIYGTGGWVATKFEAAVSSAFGSSSEDEWFHGGRAGIGAEFAATRHIFTRIEYTYTWYASKSFSWAEDITEKWKGNQHLLLVGAGYRF
jgi:outer membrane immunogenic protein